MKIQISVEVQIFLLESNILDSLFAENKSDIDVKLQKSNKLNGILKIYVINRKIWIKN